jgi:hypothetical protein
MPSPAIDGVDYQLRLRWRLHGQACLNVFNFTAHGTPDLIDDLLIPVLACVTDNLLPVLSNEITLEGADVKNITGSVAQEESQTLSSANVGETAIDSLPSTNAAVVALRTAHVGKSGRGRMFLPGIPESLQENSLVDATFIAAAVAFLACMYDAYHAGDPPAANQFYWAVRSRLDNANYPITAYVVRNVIGTMRSRKVPS